jgi:hypothetical protein
VSYSFNCISSACNTLANIENEEKKISFDDFFQRNIEQKEVGENERYHYTTKSLT